MNDSMRLSDGRHLEFERIYPLDAAFDTLAEAPDEIRENKRYKEHGDFTIHGLTERHAAGLRRGRRSTSSCTAWPTAPRSSRPWWTPAARVTSPPSA